MTKVMTQLAALAPASPWPISGSPIAFLAGFVLFTTTGLCSARSMESRGVLEQKTAVRSVIDMDALKRVEGLPPWRVALFVMCTSTMTWRWKNVA
jgi:hypothetical protein